MDASEFLEIEDNLNRKQRERDKFLGKKETLSDQLKTMGHKNLSSAKKALDDIEIEIEKEEKELQESFSNFKEKFGILL